MAIFHCYVSSPEGILHLGWITTPGHALLVPSACTPGRLKDACSPSCQSSKVQPPAGAPLVLASLSCLEKIMVYPGKDPVNIKKLVAVASTPNGDYHPKYANGQFACIIPHVYPLNPQRVFLQHSILASISDILIGLYPHSS